MARTKRSRRERAKPKKKALRGRRPMSKKKAAATRKRSKTMTATIPDPVKGAFIVFNSKDLLYLTEHGEEFSSDVTKAKLFPRAADAQATIDGALVLADAVSPFHAAEPVKASLALKTHYAFELVDGEYLLRVGVRPLADDNTCTFVQARNAVRAGLTDSLKLMAAKVKHFKQVWG